VNYYIHETCPKPINDADCTRITDPDIVDPVSHNRSCSSWNYTSIGEGNRTDNKHAEGLLSQPGKDLGQKLSLLRTPVQE
jgi:hypothetical protein